MIEKCKKILNAKWDSICENDGHETKKISKEAEKLRLSIHECINSSTKTYHYVLPTQLVSKLSDSSVDCRSVQASHSSLGAFDARTIAHKVIVLFDQKNQKVLGGIARTLCK